MTNRTKHTGLGIALGAVLGTVAGVLAGHIAIRLGIGIAIGMVLAASVRSKQHECPECAVIHQKHDARGERLRIWLSGGSD